MKWTNKLKQQQQKKQNTKKKQQGELQALKIFLKISTNISVFVFQGYKKYQPLHFSSLKKLLKWLFFSSVRLGVKVGPIWVNTQKWAWQMLCSCVFGNARSFRSCSHHTKRHSWVAQLKRQWWTKKWPQIDFRQLLTKKANLLYSLLACLLACFLPSVLAPPSPPPPPPPSLIFFLQFFVFFLSTSSSG